MSGFNYTFDASQYKPEQGRAAHPVGKFPAYISNTMLKPIKDDPDGRPRFVVEFTTEAGVAENGYNLWSSNQKAVDISHGQLSALCHATGVFRVDMNNEGAALRNARCMIEVTQQIDKDGKPTQYTQISKVYDPNGNEPGKPAAQATGAMANAGATQTQPPTSPTPAGWGNPAPQAQPQPAPNAWTGVPTQAAPQPAPAPQAGWQQNPQPAAGGPAPWAK